MIWLDIVLLAPLLWGAYIGFKKGLVGQILGLLSLSAGVWIGTQHQELVEFLLIDKVQVKYLSIICFVILFFSTLIIGAILIKIIEKFINLVQLKFLNKIAGLVLGIFKVLSFLVVIVFMIESWDSHSFVIKKKTKNTSIIYPIFKNTGDLILPKLKDQNVLDHLPNQNILTI